ncbi:hypothetical protein PS691_05495 [Pseudomonas fluorescens]|uniref:Uncharacterized protein n=1 Tax=Pseudomonas fluorescens TaxID=294 RepID=A0A5E7FJ67_PSEFL|nr:hypothetical protein PS691_05495 [Pseudomonas fluorescens]
MYANHQAFLAWAANYETGVHAGRSRPRHERWLKQLTLPSLRISTGIYTTLKYGVGLNP